MAAQLPDLAPDDFATRLRAVSPEPLSAATVAALWAHYGELRRWNARLNLVGPGTAATVVERHYGEALAALPLLGPAASLLDVGSGAGFPGFVLAAARPRLAVTLVESRERKWAFLGAAARRAELSCRCLNARVGAALDLPPVDLVTWRAVRLPEAALTSLSTLSRRMLVWSGAEEPSPPAGWRVDRRLQLTGSMRRRIVEWRV
jgi:16S rRNA (guanine(527)-N(7))-methyltransferase RsmG